MKRFFTFLCAALMTLSTVNAEVLFNCNFNDSTIGRLSGGAWGSSQKLPKDGKWYTGGNLNDTYIEVYAEQLSMAGYSSTITGKAAKSTGNHGRDYCRFSADKELAANDTVYMAFLLKVNTLKSNTAAQVIAGLQGNEETNTVGWVFSQVGVKRIDDSSYNLTIGKKNETPAVASTALNTGDIVLVVTEYITRAGKFADASDPQTVDSVNLYINPSKDSKVISKAATLTTSTAKTDATTLYGVALCTTSNSPSNMLIDEIKVATSWADLWESGGGAPIPTISADASVVCGFIPASNAFETNVKISGKDLTEAISVASNNAAVVPAVTSIGKTEAEAEGGYSLKLTITPATGDGSAKITLSSAGAANKEIAISWTGVATSANIAALKTVSAEELCALANEPIVIFVDGDDIIAQDASGAIVLSEYMGGELAGIAVGDKISNIVGEMSKEEGYHLGFQTVFVLSKAVVKSSGNTIDPLTITLDNITKYGPALVKATGVSFAETGKFAAQNYTISQESDNAQLKVPAGCDIIGEDIPAKADVIGLVTIPVSTPFIQIRTKDDVSNRTPTGIGEVRSETTDVVRSEKKVINGQLVIIKGGKMYNVIGVEL